MHPMILAVAHFLFGVASGLANEEHTPEKSFCFSNLSKIKIFQSIFLVQKILLGFAGKLGGIVW